MSSSEDNSVEEVSYSFGLRGRGQKYNRKRTGRACDVCRRRKVKCDGSEIADSSCTNCTISKTRCTYAEPSKRRFNAPPEYVDTLKARIQHLESILLELFPQADVKDSDITAESLRQSLLIPGTEHSSGTHTRAKSSNRLEARTANGNVGVVGVLEEDESFAHATRFQGRSSASALLSDALKLTMPSDVGNTVTYSDIMTRHAAFGHSYYLECVLNVLFQGPTPQFKFPAEDLMDSLVYLFFDRVHWFFPVLHMPTFYSYYHSKLHIRSSSFATILLLVCAAGSRHSSDTRVLPTCLELQDEPESERWRHAGLDYYAQVFPYLGRPPTHSPALFDLQKLSLACVYLHDSKNTPHLWTLSGLGVRMALEVGAHRKKSDATLSVDSQLWSRAFWSLVAFDRLASAATGRPCAIQDEDIDVEFPLGVDDEYWETPDPTTWKQPSDKTALSTCNLSCLKLLEILSFTLRAVYSTSKSRTMQGLVGPEWQQRVLSEIDSALNKWFDSVPEHLRWNPQQENKILLSQSALVNCLYYHVQTLAHRPFISLKNSSLSFVSLAICTNAARSSSHILEVHLAKGNPLSCLIPFAFTSGIVLLLNIWGAKKLKIRADPEMHMQDVFKCMSWLKAHARRWYKAHLTWEVLTELLSAGKLPHPQSEPPSDVPVGTKRCRQSDKENGVEATSNSQGRTDTSFQLQAVWNASPSNMVHNPSWGCLDYFSGSQISRDSDHGQQSDSIAVAMPTSGQHDFMTDFGVPTKSRHVDLPEKISDQLTGSTGGQATMLLADSAGSRHLEKVGDDYSLSASAEQQQQYATVSEFHIQADDSFLFPDLELQPVPPGPTDTQGQTGNNVIQPHSTYPEGLLDLDMLDIWTTAPTSFEARDWEDFAQEFQIEEQLRLSGIF